jgi:hypothetical protein
MKSLIDPNASVQHIISWTDTKPYKPVYEAYPNSARVCEVQETEFDVSPPLFWIDCADDVVADQFYYDTTNQTINPVVNVPSPAISGLQTV